MFIRFRGFNGLTYVKHLTRTSVNYNSGGKKIPNHIACAYTGREEIFHFCIVFSFVFLTKNIYYLSNSKKILRKT